MLKCLHREAKACIYLGNLAICTQGVSFFPARIYTYLFEFPHDKKLHANVKSYIFVHRNIVHRNIAPLFDFLYQRES